MAEGERFELSEGFHPRRFSRPVHSTALPPLRSARSGMLLQFWQQSTARIKITWYPVFLMVEVSPKCIDFG